MENGFHVSACHADNQIRLLDKLIREHGTPLVGDVDSELAEGFNGVGTGTLTIHGRHPGRAHLNPGVLAQQMPGETFGHRTAADVSGADEKNIAGLIGHGKSGGQLNGAG